MEAVLEKNPSIWTSEALNIPNWEKNGTKWFKNEKMNYGKLYKLYSFFIHRYIMNGSSIVNRV